MPLDSQSAELPEFCLSRFLPYRLNIAAAHLSAGLAKRYRREFGISVAEWRVLAHLVDAGQVSIRDLEQRVNLEKSKASRAVSRLAAVGYVSKRRNRRDKRLLYLTLTNSGRSLMKPLLDLALDYERRLDEILGPCQNGLHEALDRLLGESI